VHSKSIRNNDDFVENDIKLYVTSNRSPRNVAKEIY